MNEPVKPRWYTGQRIVTDCGIESFELFDLMKKGLQAYTHTGKRVVDSDSLPKGKRLSLEQVERYQRSKQKASVLGGPGTTSRPRSEYEIKGIAKRIYDAQSMEILNPPEDCKIMSFTLSSNDKEAANAISKVLSFKFKYDDIVKFKHECRQAHIVAPQETHTEPADPKNQSEIGGRKEANEIKDYESFIRSLQVSYVSDTEVSIKVGDNKAKNYTCKEMGFKSAENGWKLLMEVLKDGNNLFYVGSYSKDKIPEKIKYYNQRQKWIAYFTKKFITFINREYGTRISGKTNLFENQKKKNRDGLYKPTFQIAAKDADHSPGIENMSRQSLLKEIETLAMNRRREKDQVVCEDFLFRIGKLAEHASKCGWISEEQLRKMISLPDEEVAPNDAMSLVDERAEINDC